MSRLLAIEWDDCEVRYLDADVGGGRVTLHRVAALRLPHAEGSPGIAEVAAAVRADLGSGSKLPKDAVMVVSREALLVKPLGLPAAPTDELPDLVRFQMVREVSDSLDDAALDFATIPAPPSAGQQQVLAAVLPAEALARYQTLAHELGIRPVALPARPFSVAELVRETAADETTATLLIDFTATAIEFTVLVAGQVVYTRSHRLSEPLSSKGVPADVLSRETRRTLAAVGSLFPDFAVQRIRLFGDPTGSRSLLEALSKQTGLAVDVVDPFQSLASSPGGEKTAELPAGAQGRFAALVGALTAQAETRSPAMDFLNPKKPPVRRSRRKLYTAAALAAVVLVGGTLYGLARAELSSRDDTIERLNKHIAGLDKQLTLFDPVIQSADAVREWTEGEVIWLDELREFSERFPENQNAYLDHLRLSVDAATNRGKLEFLVFAKDQPTITSLQASLRRHPHYQLRVKKNRPNTGNDGYTRQFDTEVMLAEAEASASGSNEEASPKEPLDSREAAREEVDRTSPPPVAGQETP